MQQATGRFPGLLDQSKRLGKKRLGKIAKIFRTLADQLVHRFRRRGREGGNRCMRHKNLRFGDREKSMAGVSIRQYRSEQIH